MMLHARTRGGTRTGRKEIQQSLPGMMPKFSTLRQCGREYKRVNKGEQEKEWEEGSPQPITKEAKEGGALILKA